MNDTVVIFDGTQAGALMNSVQSEGLDSVELVRVTIYTLHGSHLVWGGWVLMLFGMGSLVIGQNRPIIEEEE